MCVFTVAIYVVSSLCGRRGATHSVVPWRVGGWVGLNGWCYVADVYADEDDVEDEVAAAADGGDDDDDDDDDDDFLDADDPLSAERWQMSWCVSTGLYGVRQ